jgi:hypothetical protein
MSAEASAWALQQDAGGPGPKLLLLVLANHADKDGVTYAGRALLAQECCCRTATITTNFAKLESLGLVKRLERRRGNGSRTSDWTVLAPQLEDRGPMIDAASDEYPEGVSQLAQRGSGTETVGKENGPGQVRFSGSPEQSGEQSESRPSSSSDEPDELAADAERLLKAKTKVGTRQVTSEEMGVAVEALRAFNRCSGSRYGLGAHLTPIVGRARERPSWDAAQHVRLVESAFRLRWWEQNGNARRGRRPTPAVIYGNERVFEAVVQDAIEEAKQRKEGSTASPASQAKRFVRKRPRGEL